MAKHRGDGSVGDADYLRIGRNSSEFRQPEPAIAEKIIEALGSARRVINVGAGAGSYEPVDRDVAAVEPSATMRAQRPDHRPPAIDATAEALPFPDKSFDGGMATFTVHQWADLRKGLLELRRVVAGPVVILTCDPVLVERFWLNSYAPQVLSTEARRYPPLSVIAEGLSGRCEVISVPIPLACRDGFNEAYYGRPEALLDEAARKSCSAWSFVPPETEAGYVKTLAQAIEDGSWDARHGHLRRQPTFDGSLRLLVSRP